MAADAPLGPHSSDVLNHQVGGVSSGDYAPASIRDDWRHPTSGLGTTGLGPGMDRSDLGNVPRFD
jgi:hypothetical protein